MTKRERAAREWLQKWHDRVVFLSGEAQWCHGYRTHGGDTADMRNREDEWWRRSDEASQKYARALAHLIRVTRQEARP